MAVQYVDRMAVDVRGEGDTLLFIHGLGGSMNAWVPLLPALSRQRCVRVDMPGSARSHAAHLLDEHTPHKGQLSIAVFVDALLKVCELLGVTRAHVVGHSLGSITAQHLAAQAPKLVRSLTLFGAMAEAMPAQRLAMRERAAVARSEGMFGIAEGVSTMALSASTRESNPLAVAYVRESVMAQPPEGFARSCLALAESSAAPAHQIDCPVLIVNGDEDVVTPLSGARQLAAQLRDARVEALSRCGHWPQLERTPECQRLLRDFVEHAR
jgi:3-oxoadipate enol-lactonase